MCRFHTTVGGVAVATGFGQSAAAAGQYACGRGGAAHAAECTCAHEAAARGLPGYLPSLSKSPPLTVNVGFKRAFTVAMCEEEEEVCARARARPPLTGCILTD
jgi:hypothetical protein